ncbi:hypothetical protein J5N97_020413 [Dioscorea zingiberensis]|uniref:Uncharacterized protein n=1 Tax=Dioscorea zingiberensis TaxID=325984 RepID=A0A9D5HDE8_9LILI|nr:hypothetical protein J5N97_020413 [Dioscorea zingiberensis]
MSSPLSVRRLSEGLVPPSEATPSITLPLSWIDRIPSNKAMKDILLVFNHGQEPAKAIRQALSKALVPYYPLAGVFVVSHQGELQVLCNGDGVWFVEAVADCTLEDLHFLTDFPLIINQNDLLPQPLPGTDPTDRMLMMQVTQFKCGGFVIGHRGNHAIWDGLGSAQFIKAIADIAKGQEQLKIEPVWCRELLPTPQSLPQGLSPPPKYTPDLSPAIIKLSPSHVNRMKHHIINQLGRQCSTFDVLTAKIWQSRARAMHADPHVNLHLLLSMSIRHILPQVPPGFYGNCIHLVTLTMQSSKLVNEPLHELVKMIKDAKNRLPVDYFEWIKGNVKIDPSSMGSSYESMVVTDWTRLGFLEADFGWGNPSHFFPVVSDDQKFPSCLILRAPAPEQGFRLMAQCVKKEDFGLFHDEMMDFKLGDAETNH